MCISSNPFIGVSLLGIFKCHNPLHCLPEAIVIQGLIFVLLKTYLTLTGGEQMKLYPLQIITS